MLADILLRINLSSKVRHHCVTSLFHPISVNFLFFLPKALQSNFKYLEGLTILRLFQ